jgi:hypothetical protein
VILFFFGIIVFISIATGFLVGWFSKSGFVALAIQCLIVSFIESGLITFYMEGYKSFSIENLFESVFSSLMCPFFFLFFAPCLIGAKIAVRIKRNRPSKKD